MNCILIHIITYHLLTRPFMHAKWSSVSVKQTRLFSPYSIVKMTIFRITLCTLARSGGEAVDFKSFHMAFSATAIKQLNKPKSYSIWYIYICAQLQQISSIYLLRLCHYITYVCQVWVMSDLVVTPQMDHSPAPSWYGHFPPIWLCSAHQLMFRDRYSPIHCLH